MFVTPQDCSYKSVSTLSTDGSSDNTRSSTVVHCPTAHAIAAT